ncbi:MAG TPA: hypothetical protein VLA88_05835 [Candidatus Saccharimonadales bacterium]|nr:hypothetical protein [Candidatus Saccharimonadales bacterium]
MKFFGERSEESSRVRIEDTPLEAYRYANWDPYTLLQDDLRHVTLEANAEGYHLWISSERQQMTAAVTWLASTRQAMAHTLVGSNEDKGRLPSDVANMALVNYTSAQDWLEYREAVMANENFLLEGQTFAFDIQWPEPGVNPVSTELFTSTKTLAEHLLIMSLPTMQQATDGSVFFPAEYSRYKERLVREQADIERRLRQIDLLWNNRLNPNIEPGREAYRDLTRIIEDLIALGVHTAMPVTGDSFFRLKPRLKPAHNAHNAFDPTSTAMRPPAQPLQITTAPAFNAAALRPAPPTPDLPTPAEPTTAEPFNPAALRGRKITPPPAAAAQPQGEGFNASDLRRRRQERTEDPVAAWPEVEPFDPRRHLRRRRLGAAAITETASGFDPRAHRGPQAIEESAPADRNAEPFDPRRHRPSQ